MGRKKRNNQNNGNQQGDQASKKPRHESGESYLVKKYRAEKNYAAMEAFVRYTKSHRMLDAAYVRWTIGSTPEKPFVFSTRVGGVDLGWGRGKTKEAAMDAACRAAFCLVSAHGYNNFPVDDDCLLEAPVEAPPPPPPPPPPMPLQPGIPPPPPPGAHGLMSLVPGAIDPSMQAPELIPQPKNIPTQAPEASSLAFGNPTTTPTSAAETTKQTAVVTGASQVVADPSQATPKKILKGGLILTYDPEADGGEELSMEERRAMLPRYVKMLQKAVALGK